MNESLLRKSGFGKEMDAVHLGKCPFCGAWIDIDKDFKDAISKEEFKISGLCQKCQDSMFGE
jgi:hypothetical protein